MSIFVLMQIVWIHWLGDFFLQSNTMAKNKSHSVKWLSAHIGVYTCCLLLVFNWRYALLNGVIHFVIDLFTSKVTASLWKKEDVHNFFVVVGLDQAIHLTTLISTGIFLLF